MRRTSGPSGAAGALLVTSAPSPNLRRSHSHGTSPVLATRERTPSTRFPLHPSAVSTQPVRGRRLQEGSPQPLPSPSGLARRGPELSAVFAGPKLHQPNNARPGGHPCAAQAARPPGAQCPPELRPCHDKPPCRWAHLLGSGQPISQQRHPGSTCSLPAAPPPPSSAAAHSWQPPTLLQDGGAAQGPASGLRQRACQPARGGRRSARLKRAGGQHASECWAAAGARRARGCTTLCAAQASSRAGGAVCAAAGASTPRAACQPRGRAGGGAAAARRDRCP